MFKVVEPLPTDLDQKFQGMALASASLMYSHHYDKARQGFNDIYKLLIEKQPPEQRYHKGYPLHQIGFTYVLSGKPQEALLYFILAYIEDLLTQKEGEEDKADEWPASKTLRGVYKVEERALLQLKDIVQRKKRAKQVVQDPNDIFNELARGQQAPEVVKPAQVPDVSEEKRKPGKFKSDWDKRVFVGGSYLKHYSEINQIKRICKDLGYDPVVADEFETPDGKVHHHALMLLHECSKAIFEVTEHVGQLMEIERLRDYEVEPLIVCQVKAPLSEMLEALLKSQCYEVKRYSQPEELENLVREFLS